MIIMDLDLGSLAMDIDLLIYRYKTYIVYAMLSLLLYQFHVKQLISKNIHQLIYCTYSNNSINYYGNKTIKNSLGLSSNSNKTKELCLVTTSKCVYLQENLIIILILTYYFLLLLIIKVHYSQCLYILFQNLSICFYYLCFIDILHGKEKSI